VREPVNIVNIAFIIHTEGTGVSQDRETGILYKARQGRLGLYMLSVPVEEKGFKKDHCSGSTE
jgi:hypothetical protein